MPTKQGPSFQETRHKIRKGHYLVWKALANICRTSIELTKQHKNVFEQTFSLRNKPYRGYVTQWHLAFLAKELIYSSNDHVGKELTLDEVILLANWYTNIDTPPLPNSDEASNANDLLAATIMTQLMYEQLVWQMSDPFYDIARTLVLYLEISPSVKEAKYDVNAAFREFMGLTIEKIIGVGFAVLTLCAN